MSFQSCARVFAIGFAAAVSLPARAATDSSPTGWKFGGSLGIEESYDTNIMLQSVSDLAEIESWVTTVSANLSGDWRGADGTTARLGYAPSWTQFSARSSEDFFAHRLNAALAGKSFGATYALSGTASLIDGSDEPVVWIGPGGAPATGGATVRDRRDEAVYRASARMEWTRGAWFVRPVATVYVADFQARERAIAGCLNHVDRNDLSAGLDFGRTLKPGLSGYFGYRHGAQDQARTLAYTEEYDNTYDRLLVGLDGKLVSWLTVAASAGPEFRHYGRHVLAGFPDRSVTNFYCDITATAALTHNDIVAIQVRQFQQLSSAGRGAFDDLNFDLAWRHTFSKQVSGGINLHAYNTDFLPPSTRNDWLYTARVNGSYILSSEWTLDVACTFEKGDSVVAHTEGREYERTLTSLAVRRKF